MFDFLQFKTSMMSMKSCVFLLLFLSTILDVNIADSTSIITEEEQQLIDDRIKSLVIIIISQANSYHHKKSMRLQEDIYSQSKQLSQNRPVVHVTHEDFPHVGAWTYIPLLSQIVEIYGGNSTGVLFLQDDTVLDLRRFIEVMDKYSQQVSFVGYALHDREPSIIHHFAFYEDPTQFKYPNQASGFYISIPLMLRLNLRLKKEEVKTDFNIDASHELALFIWNEGNGTSLIHEDVFCTAPPTGPAIECVTYPQTFIPCGPQLKLEEVYFAVKTCRKFHADRLKVVRTTWAPYVRNIRYFSDQLDSEIPTIDIGVPNTDFGHCEKTFGILNYALLDIRKQDDGDKIKWIVLVDDDTILSVSHILRLLSCYDPEEGVVLGERYGYGVRTSKGYNYVTGGGGTVISRSLLPRLVSQCSCPSASTPDDMYLGFCMRELRKEVVHSPLFHQARPNDYSKGYLKSHESNTISFHKHWMVDPIKVYKTWFEAADLALKTVKHQEL